ncbi:MAG: preprotein translocase subunit SecG [Prevotella sp.]|nr:preprotein translocase subunit SecG [Prevotella sp.]
MYTLFVILIVLASLLMIGIVLIQESKGGGLASGFSSANSVAGVRQTTQFIEKATWALAIIMVVISIACAYVAPAAVTEGSVIENAATEQATTNPNNVQGFGAAEQKDAAVPASPATDAKAPAQPAK